MIVGAPRKLMWTNWTIQPGQARNFLDATMISESFGFYIVLCGIYLCSDGKVDAAG